MEGAQPSTHHKFHFDIEIIVLRDIAKHLQQERVFELEGSLHQHIQTYKHTNTTFSAYLFKKNLQMIDIENSFNFLHIWFSSNNQ